MQILRFALASLALAAMPTGVAMAESGDQTDAAPTIRISAFSGKPVPRFESLKYSAVHGRVGPSLDYPIAWRYERRGLPVMVVKESRDWRMVRDPSGDEVWMHARTLGGGATVMLHSDQSISVLNGPNADARVLARAESGVIGDLMECDGAYCRIFINGRKGWVSKASLWGAPGTSGDKVMEQPPELIVSQLEQEAGDVVTR